MHTRVYLCECVWHVKYEVQKIDFEPPRSINLSAGGTSQKLSPPPICYRAIKVNGS